MLATMQTWDRLTRAGVRVLSYQEPWTEAAGDIRELLPAITGWWRRCKVAGGRSAAYRRMMPRSGLWATAQVPGWRKIPTRTTSRYVRSRARILFSVVWPG